MYELDEYLEKKGAKYFVTLLMIFYVVGTVIFNIYLRSLGIAEFDLLKLRYIFIGVTFGLITAIAPFLFLLGRRIWRKRTQQKKLTNRAKTIFRNRFEIVILALLVPWTFAYSLYVFPQIPAGFGGSKPELARLIGQADDIRGINELIAFETGVPVEKLAFEYATENSNLAIGANVYILDRNSDRTFLLLTRDLYLSSTSSLAKDLIESAGNRGSGIVTEDTKNFKPKPLIVSSKKIEGITLSLYEPPEVLTREDIVVAAAALATGSHNERKAEIVSDFITEKAPEAASKVIAAVQKQVEKTTPPVVVTPPNPDDPPVVVDPEPDEDFAQVLDDLFDNKFLDFRAVAFGDASRLCGIEKRKGRDSNQRLALVRFISEAFGSDFSEAWDNLAEKNYLVTAQGDADFSCKLMQIFQGAEDGHMVIARLNETEASSGPTFIEVRDGALELMDVSAQVNTNANRKYVSQILIRHFSQKAKQENNFWNEPKYLYDGRGDEPYFENIRKALTDQSSWEGFRTALIDFQTAFENPVIEETCSDGILNQDETEIDCGGEACDACVIIPAETCTDGILNQDETEIDCGGVCDACVVPETCVDGILNQDETEIDCGGTVCDECVVIIEETCTDGLLNQDETEIDCGGSCDACAVPETCEDGFLNQDETEIDCGGVCDACAVPETCTDGILNQDETEIDCGGTVCDACVVPEPDPMCSDGILNQDETEIDCGGTVCDECVNNE